MTPFDAEPVDDAPVEEEVDPAETVDPQEVAEILAKYWASPAQAEDELFQKMLEREEEFFNFLMLLGMLQMYRISYSAYYGFAGTSGELESQSIRFAGDDDERVEYCVNEFRSFCDQIFNMTVKNRPAFQAQAINTDVRTLGQIESSDNVIKYYYEQVFGERKEKEVVAAEGKYGKAYTYIDWDPDGGPDVEIEEPVEDDQFGPMEPVKKTVKAGKFEISRKYMWDVVCDPYVSEHDGHEWRIVLDVQDKYKMVARYPLYAKVIDDQSGAAPCSYANMFPGSAPNISKGSDKVVRRTLLHAPNTVLPQGRKAVFVGEKLVEDGPLPIEVIPLFDFMSSELDGTCVGISDLWNLIPEQQMNNQILSDIATNVEAFGRPPLAVVDGSDLDIDALANGQKVMMVPSMDQMPKTVDFPQVNEVSIKLVEMNRRLMQALSGLNGIARGESDASVKSGTHAALYHAMAVENQSPRQAALDLHRERITNALLLFLKKYAKHPQLASIAGEDERANLQYLTQKDFEGVQRVVVKTANPLMRTQAGRLQIAELLRDWPGQPLKDPTEIIELLVSGQFKPMYNPTRAEQLRIRRENELLAKGPPTQDVPSGEIDPMTGQPAVDPATGQPKTKKIVPTVPVLATDNAAKHIASHLEVLSSPDTLDNQAKFDATLAHIMDHIATARDGDPYTAQLLGLPPPQGAMGTPQEDPNASASGKGPSEKDMMAAGRVTVPPDSQTAMENQDDSQSAFGRVPKPAKSPVGPGN